MSDRESDNDVTQWLTGLAQGDPRAVNEIWNRYFARLVNLARRKLGDSSRRMADEEDIALSAFHSFCQRAAAGHFPRLDDRHDLWGLLVAITSRKAGAEIRRSHRRKRGSGTVRGESVFTRRDAEEGPGIDGVFGREPTPEVAALVAEQCRRLLEALPDPVLRDIALRKLEGYSNEEIATQLECAPRTVERKLAKIRQYWEEPASQDA